jgi:hypothetical protein
MVLHATKVSAAKLDAKGTASLRFTIAAFLSTDGT